MTNTPSPRRGNNRANRILARVMGVGVLLVVALTVAPLIIALWSWALSL